VVLRKRIRSIDTNAPMLPEAIHGQHIEGEQTELTEALYPLAVVASDLDCGVRDLERRCNGAVTRNADGLRCVPGNLVRELVGERDAKLAEQREARRQEHERVAAEREARRPELERRRREKEERQARLDAETAAMNAIADQRLTPRFG
jgi:hypothetical protein